MGSILDVTVLIGRCTPVWCSDILLCYKAAIVGQLGCLGRNSVAVYKIAIIVKL